MEYRTIVLKLDTSDRPPLPLGKISKQARRKYVRGQQKWFEQAAGPIRNRVHEIGCIALNQLWHSGELVVEVPSDRFDEKVEALQNMSGVADYELYAPRQCKPESE